MNQQNFTNEIIETFITKNNHSFSLSSEHSIRAVFDHIQSKVFEMTDVFMSNADFKARMTVASKLAVLAPDAINEFITALAQHTSKPPQLIYDLVVTSQNTLRYFLSAVNDLQSPVVQAAGGGLSKSVIAQFLETEIREVLSKLLFANLYVEHTHSRQLNTKYEVEHLFWEMRKSYEEAQFIGAKGALS